MIILIGGEKGGTGKTTVATNLAAMRIVNGHDVLLVDTDKQGSASAWSDIRDTNKELIRVPNIQKFGKNLVSDMKDLQNRYGDIIIDAGGRDSVELRAAMVVADLMYIPVQASQFDIWTLSIINDLVHQTVETYNPSLSAFIIINRANTNPIVNEVEEAKGVFRDFDCLKLSPAILKERISYRKAARAGLSIVELSEKDSKAIKEINALYEEIFND